MHLGSLDLAACCSTVGMHVLYKGYGYASEPVLRAWVDGIVVLRGFGLICGILPLMVMDICEGPRDV